MSNKLVIEPSKLKFNGPFTRTVVVEMCLHNPTAQVIAFKVKTISPEHYLVKPSKGVIAPEQSAIVTVHVLPLENDSQVDHFITSKQKFLVQWVANDDSVGKSVAELFGSSAQVHNVKLECEFNAQPSQSMEMSRSYKSVKDLSAGSPGLRGQSDKIESGHTTHEQLAQSSSRSTQWCTRPRLVTVSALVLLCAIFLAYYFKLAYTNSGPNN